VRRPVRVTRAAGRAIWRVTGVSGELGTGPGRRTRWPGRLAPAAPPSQLGVLV